MVISLQLWVFLLLNLVVLGLAAWALVDALVRPAAAFPRAGKRTKGFWLAITGAATALAFIGVPAPIGIGLLGPFSFVTLLAVAAAGVYLADVRPAVRPYSGGRGPRRPGGTAGGW